MTSKKLYWKVWNQLCYSMCYSNTHIRIQSYFLTLNYNLVTFSYRIPHSSNLDLRRQNYLYIYWHWKINNIKIAIFILNLRVFFFSYFRFHEWSWRGSSILRVLCGIHKVPDPVFWILVRCAGSCFIIITLGPLFPKDAEVGKSKHILLFIEFQANLETRTC